MIDPASITVAMIVGYAAPKLLDAAIGSVGGKLTEAAIKQVRQTGAQLRQAILRRVKPEGQAGVAQMLEAAESSPEQRQKLETWLDAGMAKDPQFAAELRTLAQEIHQVIQIDQVQGKNIQQVFGGQGIMAPDANAPIIQAGENAKFEFNYGKD